MINAERRRSEYNFRGKVRNHHGTVDWLTGFMGLCIVTFVIAAAGIMVAVVVL